MLKKQKSQKSKNSFCKSCVFHLALLHHLLCHPATSQYSKLCDHNQQNKKTNIPMRAVICRGYFFKGLN